MSGTRHSLCNSFYEDFEKVEIAKPCPICFYHNAVILGGSHPRKPVLQGNCSKINLKLSDIILSNLSHTN